MRFLISTVSGVPTRRCSLHHHQSSLSSTSSVVEKHIIMAPSLTSVNYNAGTLAAGVGFLFGIMELLQPPDIINFDELGPFYQWLPLPEEWIGEMVETKARVVGFFELCASLMVLLPTLAKKPRKLGLLLQTSICFLDATGHYEVKDKMVTLSATLLLCSGLALLLEWGMAMANLASKAGTVSACFALFGAHVGLVQPPLLLNMERLGPYYTWYFTDSITDNLETRAQLVGIINLGVGLSVILPTIRNKSRVLGLALLSCLWLYSLKGHDTVQDNATPVVLVMLACSLVALLSELLTSTNKRKRQ